jgi:hypothetical protein
MALVGVGTPIIHLGASARELYRTLNTITTLTAQTPAAPASA